MLTLMLLMGFFAVIRVAVVCRAATLRYFSLMRRYAAVAMLLLIFFADAYVAATLLLRLLFRFSRFFAVTLLLMPIFFALLPCRQRYARIFAFAADAAMSFSLR